MDDLYDDFLNDYGVRDNAGFVDEYGAEMLWDGWFADDDYLDEKYDGEWDRMEFRDFFYDYMGISYQDFDWDAWREWMGYE